MRKDELDELKAKYKLWRVFHFGDLWGCDYCKHQAKKQRDLEHEDWKPCYAAPSFRPQKDYIVCLGFMMEGNYVEHD